MIHLALVVAAVLFLTFVGIVILGAAFIALCWSVQILRFNFYEMRKDIRNASAEIREKRFKSRFTWLLLFFTAMTLVLGISLAFGRY